MKRAGLIAGLGLLLGCAGEGRRKRDAGASPASDGSAPAVALDAIAIGTSYDAAADQPVPEDMVRIPGGPDYRGETSPLSQMGDFYLDRTEVTVAQYRACVEGGRCSPPVQRSADAEPCGRATRNWGEQYDEHPVNCVTPEQAQTFCRSHGKRLPTDEQWERAARGLHDERRFPWGNEKPDCERAIVTERVGAKPGCGRDRTAPVGSRPRGASSFGTLDMIGNVSEFTISEQAKFNVDEDVGLLVILQHGGGFEDASSLLATDGLHHSTACVPAARCASPGTGFRCAWVPYASPEYKRIRWPL